MNTKYSAVQTRAFSIVTAIFVALFSLSAVLLSGCERMSEVVAPPDTTAATLKVGVIQPSKYYTSYTKGAELARAELNAAGGILGMQVEFVPRDNQTSPDAFPMPEATIQVANELVEMEKVAAILGPIFSTNAVEIAPIINIPTLAAATDARVTKAGEFIFVVGAPNSLHGQGIAEFAVNELEAKTAATIHQDGDVYSMGHLNAFNERFKALGGEIAVADVYQSGDTDFSAQLAKVKAAAPDVLLLSSFAPEVPLLIKQAKEMEITATIIGGDGWADPELFFTTLEDNTPLDGSYFTTGLSDPSNAPPSTQTFIAAYTEMYGMAPDSVAASGYDGMKLLAMGIEKAASTDAVAVRDAIAAITDYAGATLISRYDENRNPVKEIGGVLEIRDGKTQPYVSAMPETDAMPDAGEMTTDTPATTDETAGAEDMPPATDETAGAADMPSDATEPADETPEKDAAGADEMKPDTDASGEKDEADMKDKSEDTSEEKDADDAGDMMPATTEPADEPSEKDAAGADEMETDPDAADAPEKKDAADTKDKSEDTAPKTSDDV